MMEDIEALRRMAVFAAVVEAQSFSDAARRLGVAKSAVSKQVAELEQSLGVRLMNRTTRRSSLTEAGERFYRSCVRILEEASRATADAQSLQTQPVGTLRLTGPTFFGTRYVVPQVSQFLETYPEINVDLFLTDRHVDMFEENIDLAVRIGRLADSSLVAKKLAEQSTGFFTGEADPRTASTFRAYGSDVEARRDDVLDALAVVVDGDGDRDAALAAATVVVQGAYEEYTGRLEAMGVNPKPVC